MNISIKKQQINTNLIIEADFDDLEELEKQIDKYRTGVRSLLLTFPWKTKSRNR